MTIFCLVGRGWRLSFRSPLVIQVRSTNLSEVLANWTKSLSQRYPQAIGIINHSKTKPTKVLQYFRICEDQTFKEGRVWWALTKQRWKESRPCVLEKEPSVWLLHHCRFPGESRVTRRTKRRPLSIVMSGDLQPQPSRDFTSILTSTECFDYWRKISGFDTHSFGDYKLL